MKLFKIDMDADVSAKVTDSQTPLCVIMERNDKRLVFPLHAIIAKNKTDKMDPLEQFYILNDFLDKKGEEFKDMFFNTYVEVYEYLNQYYDSIEDSQVEVYPHIHRIFDMIKLEETMEHAVSLVNEGIIKVPSNLSQVLDEFMVKDGIGSREQTYLHKDYIQLAGMITFIKATYPILIHFVNIFVDEKNGATKDAKVAEVYFLYSELMECEPMNKLKQFIEQIVLGPKIKDIDIETRMLEKNLSREEFTDYFLAQVLIEFLTISSLLRDADDKHTILKLFGFLMGRFKSKKQTQKQIKVMTQLKGADGDLESTLECSKINTDLLISTVRLINVSCRSVDDVLLQFSRYSAYKGLLTHIDVDGKKISVYEIRDALESLMGLPISKSTTILVKCFIKKILDPRFISYMEIAPMLNVIAVCFVYMYNRGHRDLALTLLGIIVDNNAFFEVYSENSFKKLDQNLLDELRTLFPLYTPPNKQFKDPQYAVEDGIKDLSKMFLDYKRVTPFSVELLRTLFQEGVQFKVEEEYSIVLLSCNVKKAIAEFLVDNEKIRAKE